jgi:hypothetical protein
MNYNIIAIALVTIGFGLLFLLDTFIDKETNNNIMKTIRDNNLMLGVICLGAGYYVYTLGQKQPTLIEEAELDTSEPLVPMVSNDRLPSYEEATSTDEILNS